MNSHCIYFLILGISLAGPLALSFDRKVAFYRKWKYVFAAIILPAIFYIVWDAWFTDMKVWEFNPGYVTGIHFFNLPLEEVLFFFVVPYCCMFIYECIRSYFPKLQSNPVSEWILFGLGILLFITALIYRERQYTFFTCIFNAVFISLLFFLRKRTLAFNSAAFLVSYAIILLPFMAVNGLLTSIPVVIYNNAENIGIRISSIPVEDIFYGMLLMMLNVLIYEKLLGRE